MINESSVANECFFNLFNHRESASEIYSNKELFPLG